MEMKSTFRFLPPALLIIVYLVFVHDANAKSGPKEILEKYCNALIHGRLEEAYELVSAKDKAVKSLESYLSEPFAEALVSKTSYEISEVKVIGNKATATAAITMPDIRFDIMALAFLSAFQGFEVDNELLLKGLAERCQDSKLPLTTINKTFNLVNENDGWKVFLDWKSEQIKAKDEVKIKDLLSDAKKLKKDNKLHGALEKYKKVLELDSKLVAAKEGLREIQKAIQATQEKQEYIINSIVLFNFSARYYANYLDARVPGVEFKLRNKGNRTLREVEVTVYFKDSSGAIIAEEKYNPIFVGSFSASSNRLLKPNYIWQMERGKFYTAKSVPSEWEEGSVTAKITNIEFED
ncbi:MAG: hypothetical protein JRI71_04425 [Deltaproteobacteria bacterium]|nr:hypothetical protein [Deltaproteobacteria bacterium]